MHEKVQLACEIVKRDDTEITLAYTVKNGLPCDIYLFDPLTDFRGQQFVPIHNRVYVFWDDDDLLHVTKRLWPVPEDVDVYMPEVPYLTRVAAGAEIREELRLPIPLIVNFPYRWIDEDEPHSLVTRDSKQMLFSIGYLAAKDPQTGDEIVPTKAGEYYQVGYGLASENQVIAAGEPVEIEVTAQDVQQ